ncbi:hypothetical protein N0V90_006351 [Kalmusia sp. IMI 367209]|nr:hypothetical protein N0V90_006351 [Kalmusia sp. IMI 367209]
MNIIFGNTTSATLGGPSSTVSSFATTVSPSSHVETVTSVSAGQTVLVTITANSIPTSQSPTELDSANEHASSKSSIAAIAGGTVGGVALLAAGIFLFIFLRRKRRIKEERRATIPPQFTDSAAGDMSEQLNHANIISNSEAKIVTGSADISSSDHVPQLDGTAVIPTNEANVEPVGNIPELPATEWNSNPFATPKSSEVTEALQESKAYRNHKSSDANNHVMS